MRIGAPAPGPQSYITEFILIPIKRDVDVEEAGTPANRALRNLVASLKEDKGSTRVFFGRQIENPDIYVVVVIWNSLSHSSVTHRAARNELWTSLAGSCGIAGSPGRPAFHTDDRARVIHRVLLSPRAGAVRSFLSPTTEVFTGYGAEPGFESAVADFAMRVALEDTEGLRSNSLGPTVEDISKGNGERGPAVTLVMGWESKKAHMEAKDKPDGAIQGNIRLLRGLRKEVEMWHVNLKEQH